MMNPNHDANIPVLTEIITVVEASESPYPEKQELPTPSAQAAVPLPFVVDTVNEAVIAESAPVSSSQTKREWDRIEREVSERVLTQMMSRIDFVLEQRIRDSLADVLQTAMAGLSDDIREGLQQTLEAVVTRAVSQEIIQLQKLKT